MSRVTVNFMIVGAQKSGTTALAHFLSQHPQIAMARNKEAHVFDAPSYTGTEDHAQIAACYAPYFDADDTQKLRAEATPLYLYWPEIAPQLARYNGDLKLIIILRNPVERAVSHYEMERGRSKEQRSIGLAFLLEAWRLYRAGDDRSENSARRVYSYLDRGHYARQLENLRRYFPDEQLLIIENQALLQQNDATLHQTLQFLGLKSGDLPLQEEVFAGRYGRAQNRLLKIALRYYYKIPNRRLKKLLLSMGYSANWPWL